MKVIEARSVWMAYRSDEFVLTDVSLDADRGELVALTGPSGCGKSTLLFCLGGLVRPRRGTIRLLGTETTQLSDAARARMRAEQIGFVFQDALLDPSRRIRTSVKEASLYSSAARHAYRNLDARVRAILSELGVSSLVERRPGQMSGGQAQRVALARALLLAPPVVLADEPTGNLDRSAGEAVINALTRYARDTGGCVIFATHDDEVTARCDRTVTL
jgi:ABC-type lipoprotein export system ATPase subunit